MLGRILWTQVQDRWLALTNLLGDEIVILDLIEAERWPSPKKFSRRDVGESRKRLQR